MQKGCPPRGRYQKSGASQDEKSCYHPKVEVLIGSKVIIYPKNYPKIRFFNRILDQLTSEAVVSLHLKCWTGWATWTLVQGKQI